MKKLKQSTAAKITAVILSYIMLAVFAVSLISTLVMGYCKFYFSSEQAVKEDIFGKMAQREARYLTQLFHRGADLEEYYADKNVYFEIKNADTGKNYASNYDEDKIYIATVKDTIIDESWYKLSDVDGEIFENGGYIVDVDNGIGEALKATRYSVVLSVAENMTKSDLFSVAQKLIELGFRFQYAVIIIAVLSLIGFITLLCFLYCSAGHRADGSIRLNFTDKIPFDICVAVALLAVLGNIILLDRIWDTTLVMLATAVLLFTADYFFALGITMSFATRVKTETLFKNTLAYRLFGFANKALRKFFGWAKYVFFGLKPIAKAAVMLAICLGFQIIVSVPALLCFDRFPEVSLLIFILSDIIIAVFVIYLASVLGRIQKGGREIANGDFEYKIDTDYMYGDFKSFAQNLNSINSGLQTAVNEKMKSERFKTELITNVSHDIKTPLTSIINYVDLIKKEDCENPKITEYTEVLDRQSSRLKKLVEDLTEASKASSGALTVNLQKCDMGVLLSQTVGEFKDRLEKNGLKVILYTPDENITILADGRHLWRVFDNLMSNICKYAMPDTRVYLDVKAQNGKAVATFRNISKSELNISPEELMERFVRGDASRNTEGSGLGLSIAKSLTELQNGRLDITIDGDLFKAEIIFDLAGE